MQIFLHYGGDVLKADTTLNKCLLCHASTETWRSVRFHRGTCDCLCKFPNVDLFYLKLNQAHPCQESTEMVWLWLFVTSPFFRDEWTTVNPFHVLHRRYHVVPSSQTPIFSRVLASGFPVYACYAGYQDVTNVPIHSYQAIICKGRDSDHLYKRIR